MGCGPTLNLVVSKFNSHVLPTWLGGPSCGEAGQEVPQAPILLGGPHWAPWASHMLIWNRFGSAYMLRSAKESGGAQGRNNRPWSKGVDLHVTGVPGWDVVL